MQTSIKTRISDELKSDATHVLTDCGLTVSAAIRLFLEQVVKSQGLPFNVKRVPSKKMKIALAEAAQVETLAAHRFDSIEDMVSELNCEGK